MTNTLCLLLSIFLVLLPGCAMFASWKSIPAPGGCDKCHTVVVGHNWQLTNKIATLSSEQGRLPFQTEQSVMPQGSRPASSIDIRDKDSQHCFECHKLPNAGHRGMSGNYHHKHPVTDK